MVVSTPSASPYLMPALVVSVLLNVATSAAIVGNYWQPQSLLNREDVLEEDEDDPLQECVLTVFKCLLTLNVGQPHLVSATILT